MSKMTNESFTCRHCKHFELRNNQVSIGILVDYYYCSLHKEYLRRLDGRCSDFEQEDIVKRAIKHGSLD